MAKIDPAASNAIGRVLQNRWQNFEMADNTATQEESDLPRVGYDSPPHVINDSPRHSPT